MTPDDELKQLRERVAEADNVRGQWIAGAACMVRPATWWTMFGKAMGLNEAYERRYGLATNITDAAGKTVFTTRPDLAPRTTVLEPN